MTNKITSLLSTLLVCILLFSCTAEEDTLHKSAEDEIPIDFECIFPNENLTRAKTEFSTNDLIYITAKITLADNNTVVQSTELKYDGNKFNPQTEAERLRWPADAVKGEFVAYYYPVGVTAPTADTDIKINLSRLKEATDDLLMAKQELVSINGIVLLRFAHTTTKLRFNGLQQEATSIIFQCNDATYKMNNQLVLTYSDTEGYKHEFQNNGTDTITISKNAGTTSALFFLHVEPEWKDKVFTVTQKQGIETKKETNLPSASSRLYTMRTGRAYRISFYGGKENSALEEENDWYADKTFVMFYTKEQIASYLNGKTELSEDLDFNNLVLDDPAIIFSSTRSIMVGSSFNGKHHTIRNVYVKNGLFGNVPAGAKIENLRLENVKVISEGQETAGLLTTVNKGTITNVRLSGNNNIGTSNVNFVGGLVGKNDGGTINNVKIEGTLIIDAYTENATEKAREFSVGGLVGYNNGTINACQVIAGGLLTVGGTYTAGDIAIGGLVGYNAKTCSVTNSEAYTRIDASLVQAKNSYVGGFCGINRGILKKNEAHGEVKGAKFGTRSAIGGFLGYTTSLTEKTDLAIVDGCGATGNIFETATTTGSVETALYTGGFCGFSEIDLKNVYSTGKLNLSTGFTGEWKKGALTGLISADKTIYNSFSITLAGDNSQLSFNGEGTCKLQNGHIYGQMLTEQGVVGSNKATVIRLNNAVSASNGYWGWNMSEAVYDGAPYLLKP